jgi:hypothetical protein
MRGWTSSIGGAVCVGAAMWMLAQGYSDKTVLVLAGAALVLFFRGYQGLTIGEAANDAMLGASFVADPKRTAINYASDRMDNLIDGDGDGNEQHHRIDVDKIMDRYLEERSRNAPAAQATPSASPIGFGRKGI